MKVVFEYHQPGWAADRCQERNGNVGGRDRGPGS